MRAHSLVIGASGQVGGCVCSALDKRNASFTGTYATHPVGGFARLDIVDREAVFDLVLHRRPDVIFLPASLSNVDYCESNPAESFRANVEGVRNVAEAAERVGALLVYLSSDYVFDGMHGPYSERDIPNPICEYGKQKLIAEHVVAMRAGRALIVRTTIVFGPERLEKNFVYRLVRELSKGAELRVPCDQVGSPTYGPDLAEHLIGLAQSGSTGIFNVTGPERVSRYDFALAAARAFDLPLHLIRPIATPELAQRAKRPLNAGLLDEKLIAVAGRPTMGFEEGLVAMRAHLEREGDRFGLVYEHHR